MRNKYNGGFEKKNHITINFFFFAQYNTTALS